MSWMIITDMKIYLKNVMLIMVRMRVDIVSSRPASIAKVKRRLALAV